MPEEKKPIIDVIIPAYNEQDSIAKVIGDIDRSLVREIVVANNNSNDGTGAVAGKAGATVVFEPEQGYGAACLRAMEHLKSKTIQPDIVVFLDADYSDHPEELKAVVSPIIDQSADLVIGSRTLGNRERGSMTPQQLFGNWLSTTLMRIIYNAHYSDLGPFRAVKWDKLLEMKMADQNYGWTVEMQLKAAKQKMKFAEVPVSYRRRIGVSKVSGTVKGTVMAGYKIITTIFKYM